MADFDATLQRLRGEGRLRQLEPLTDRQGCYVNYRGSRLLNLSSNDYLGLAGNHGRQQAFYDKLTAQNLVDEYGLGAASSRLLTGDSSVSHRLEHALRDQYGAPAALLFNSGYHANIGILPGLVGKGDLILSDKLNHASIHDGMRLCRATHKRYNHCDYGQLERMLAEAAGHSGTVVVVTESVFSMDGDVADLSQLVALKKKYNALLYVDDAHGVGLYGDKGLGMAEEQGVLHDIDLLVGTFGKAYASVGAFVLCSSTIRDYLINHSRSLIFTTALPPVVLNWNLHVFLQCLQMAKERQSLRTLSEKLRQALRRHGLTTGGTTNIVPVMIGENSLAVNLAADMRELGYLIFPVRPPTVPEGTARFRLSLTADMRWTELAEVPAALCRCAEARGVSL